MKLANERARIPAVIVKDTAYKNKENNYNVIADLAWNAQGTLGYTRPRLLRKGRLLTLPLDLGLASFMTIVSTLCALRSCEYGQEF